MSTATRRLTVPYDVTQSSGNILDLLLKYADICAREFCGRCIPCRYGTHEWVFALQKIVDKKGTLADLETIKTINQSMIVASFCPLGLRSPFVIEAILKYQHQAIEDFITKGAPLPEVTELPKFLINDKLCDGCPSYEKAPCKTACSVSAITGEQGALHEINQAKCYRCDECTPVCPQKAIDFL